ncbi:beta-ketoacyl synthase chain length factor [Niveibacterium sp.]|uniref:beta-ketoacyl synthase chain length factor n=1 Tax=Niveibacterium sp. TaxID=2017444 RepID=UPI0035AD8366
MSGVLSLSSWAAWAPGLQDRAAWQAWVDGLRAADASGEPALPEIPAMMRRRADRLARMTLRAALDVLGERSGLPVVYVSRHGSVGRSAELLEALARGDALSPAGFAASVHNAAPGLLGIVRKDPAPYTALAAETGGVLAMLAEVQAFLSDGHDEVLAILSDEPVPACYSAYVTEPEFAMAWAGVFRLDTASGLALSQVAAADPVRTEAEILAWVRWLLGNEPGFDCAQAWQVRRV